MATLPTGTVTLLFSDIEGSTKRWTEHPEEMARALRRHDEVLRSTIEAGGGHVFKTMGDAFCAVFWRPQDAIAAVIDAQRLLIAEDFSDVDGLRVRMALHTGTTYERDGDYFGPTVNRVARILSIVNGGQVVLSRTTAELVRDAMPPESDLRDLGGHRLKDLVEPERVWQLIAAGLPEKFSPLRSLETLPNNLPQQLTALIGRDEVVAEVETQMTQCRLVSLVGTGGVGKTRVALQVGANLLDGSEDGVWFIDLAPLSDPGFVAGTIASTLGVREVHERPLLETLVDYLKRKRLLLILDNCEHVIEEAAKVADTIVRGCPEVRVLATSREPLRIAGERAFPMPTLALPAPDATLAVEDAGTFGAVALFAERAAAADNRFALSVENLPVVLEICRRLDGIALAIELAAARVKMLTPRQLAQNLDERFRVLTGGSRTALPRQQTMRALIDWSFDLLSASEQRLFGRLSIFAGGWTLAEVSSVCSDEQLAGGALDRWEVFDLLSSLVEKSLVVAEPAGEEQRYRLLESTRDYARERLTQSGELESVARAHAAAYLDLAHRLWEAFDETTDRVWLQQTAPEMDNWRSAIGWAVGARADVLLGQRLVAKLGDVWHSFAASEGLRWVRLASEMVDEATPTTVVAYLDLTEALLYESVGRIKSSYAPAERAGERFRELGDAMGVARAQHIAGCSLARRGQIAQGEALLEAALETFRIAGARRLMGRTLRRLATAREDAGDLAAARALYAEAHAIFKATGAERNAAAMAGFLAELEFREGHTEAALRLATEALGDDRQINDEIHVMTSLTNAAAYLIALDRHDESLARAREALTLAMRHDNGVLAAIALLHSAAVAALRDAGEAGDARDDRARAARLIGFVNARLGELEHQHEYTEQREHDRVVAALREAIGDPELARLMAEGHAWDTDRAVAESFII